MKCFVRAAAFALACWGGGLFAVSGWIMNDTHTFSASGGIGYKLLSKVAEPFVVSYYLGGLSQACIILSLIFLAAAGLMKSSAPQIPYAYGGNEPVRRFAKV